MLHTISFEVFELKKKTALFTAVIRREYRNSKTVIRICLMAVNVFLVIHNFLRGFRSKNYTGYSRNPEENVVVKQFCCGFFKAAQPTLRSALSTVSLDRVHSFCPVPLRTTRTTQPDTEQCATLALLPLLCPYGGESLIFAFLKSEISVNV